MTYEDLLPLIDALPEGDRRRVAEYAAAHVKEPAAVAIARAKQDTKLLPEVHGGEEGEVPAAGLAWRNRYEAWLRERGDDWFTQEEWESAFGNLRDRSTPRSVSFR